MYCTKTSLKWNSDELILVKYVILTGSTVHSPYFCRTYSNKFLGVPTNGDQSEKTSVSETSSVSPSTSLLLCGQDQLQFQLNTVSDKTHLYMSISVCKLFFFIIGKYIHVIYFLSKTWRPVGHKVHPNSSSKQ